LQLVWADVMCVKACHCQSIHLHISHFDHPLGFSPHHAPQASCRMTHALRLHWHARLRWLQQLCCVITAKLTAVSKAAHQSSQLLQAARSSTVLPAAGCMFVTGWCCCVCCGCCTHRLAQ
jgi:hypothetical protein